MDSNQIKSLNSKARSAISTINYQLSTINYQLSTVNYQLSTVNYQQKLIFILMLITAIALFLLNLAMGSVSIPLPSVLTTLIGGEAENPAWSAIILKLRLPSALTATLAGSALAVGGLQMQTLFRNPLAGPFVLGINSGAGLGVALVVLSGGIGFLHLLGDFSIILAASLGAALVLGLVVIVSRYVPSTATLLILGLMFGNATISLVSILLHFSSTEQVQSYLNWTFGSFGGVTPTQLPIFTITILITLIAALLTVKPLNLLLLGENYARSLGLNLPLIRWQVILTTSILAGTVTAFCGPISFLGVAVPHLCRGLLKTEDCRLLLPSSVMAGATLALCANLLAGVPGSQVVLPLNAVTALIGAPVVAWIVLRPSISRPLPQSLSQRAREGQDI